MRAPSGLRRAALGTLLLAASAGLCPAEAQTRELELGAEFLGYRTDRTLLNRGDLLGLDRDEGLARARLHWKERYGPWRLVLRGYAERGLSRSGNRSRWVLRQAQVQKQWGAAWSVRAGKQRVAWGSGFAWNPGQRLERPKNPLNTGLEQEGVWGLRVEWTPASWLNLQALGARVESQPGDLLFDVPRAHRAGGGLRARFLVADSDVALVLSAARGRPRVLGLDLGRAVGGAWALHLEGACSDRPEVPAPGTPPQAAHDGPGFCRAVLGALHTGWADTSLALEYFYNGAGDGAREFESYLAALAAAFEAGRDPRLGDAARRQAQATYAILAGRPFAGGMGLRHHYVHAAWTRTRIRGDWSATLRVLWGPSDGGVALTPGLSWSAGRLSAGLDAVLLLGPRDSEYRLAPVRAALQSRVQVVF